jgi:ribonucleotide monophosphatase NagD (HAD superfamily)
MLVASGAMSFAVGVLIRTINRRDKKLDERQQQMIDCRVTEMQYTRSIGSLAHITARKVKDASCFPIANGDLSEAIKYYKVKEHELEDHYQKQNIVNNVKGG